MDEKNYLKSIDIRALKEYVDKGYLSWSMLEADEDSKIELIREVYPHLDPLVMFRDLKSLYIDALYTTGYKADSLFKQLDDIRSGEVWKKI